MEELILTKNFIYQVRATLTAWERGIGVLDLTYEEVYAIEDATCLELGLPLEDEEEDFCDDVDETFYDPYCGCEIFDDCGFEWQKLGLPSFYHLPGQLTEIYIKKPIDNLRALCYYNSTERK